MTEAAKAARNAYYSAWRAEHREELREYQRAWHRAHPDKFREYNTRHWEKQAAKMQAQQAETINESEEP